MKFQRSGTILVGEERAERFRHVVGYRLASLEEKMFGSPVTVAEKAVGHHFQIVHHHDPESGIALLEKGGIGFHESRKVGAHQAVG